MKTFMTISLLFLSLPLTAEETEKRAVKVTTYGKVQAPDYKFFSKVLGALSETLVSERKIEGEVFKVLNPIGKYVLNARGDEGGPIFVWSLRKILR